MKGLLWLDPRSPKNLQANMEVAEGSAQDSPAPAVEPPFHVMSFDKCI